MEVASEKKKKNSGFKSGVVSPQGGLLYGFFPHISKKVTFCFIQKGPNAPPTPTPKQTKKHIKHPHMHIKAITKAQWTDANLSGVYGSLHSVRT